MDDVTRARTQLIQSLGQKVTALYERILSQVQSWNRTIGDRKSALKREAAALGIDL